MTNWIAPQYGVGLSVGLPQSSLCANHGRLVRRGAAGRLRKTIA